MFLKNDLDNLLSSNFYYSLVIDITEEGSKNIIRVIIRTCKYDGMVNKRKTNSFKLFWKSLALLADICCKK